MDENEYIKINSNSLTNLDSFYTQIISCYKKYINHNIYEFEESVSIDNKKLKLYLYVFPPYFNLKIDDNEEKQIKLPPVEIEFLKKDFNQKKIIYTLKQLKRCLKNYKYQDPKFKIGNYFNDIQNFYYIKVDNKTIKVIENENDEELFNNVVKFNKCKFNEKIIFNLSNLPVNFKDYLKIKDKYKENNFEFYVNYLRTDFLINISRLLTNNNQIFITGIHGIGKSLSLFMLKFLNYSFAKKFVYFNLDVTKNKTKEEWFKIIKYEISYIFNTYKDFKTIIDDNEIKNSNDYLSAIYNILLKIINEEYIKETCIIIDQYKIELDFSNKIKKIQQLIKSKNNIKLIICSSINDNLIRNDLIEKMKDDMLYSYNCNYLYIIKNLCEHTKNNEKTDLNKVLRFFNYLPIYKQLFVNKDKNSFDEIKSNIIKKIISKLEQYFSKKAVNNLEGIYKIQKNINKFLSVEEFEEEEKYFSMKYFIFYKINNLNIIDLENEFQNISLNEQHLNKFFIKYSFPFMENAINEFKNNEYIKLIKNGLYIDQSLSFKGELYEFLFLKYLTQNIRKEMFSGIFKRITKKIEIYSPFDILQKKIDNSIYINSINEFMETEFNDVILFIFKFTDVKRYDALILVKEFEICILLQITNHKKMEDLKCYLNKNIKNEDCEKIKKEFKNVYNQDIQYFYLLFIINPEHTSEEELKSNYFNNSLSFILFNPFKGKFFKFVNNKIIDTDKIEINDENKFIEKK